MHCTPSEAFVILNFSTYALWQEKPLGVDRPYCITDYGVEETNSFWRAPWKKWREMYPLSTTYIAADAIRSLVPSCLKFQNSYSKRLLWPWMEFLLFQKSRNRISSTESEGGRMSPHSIRAGAPRDSTYSQRTILGASGVAKLFWAIHRIGWSFEFPSHIEKLLWRISLVSIVE